MLAGFIELPFDVRPAMGESKLGTRTGEHFINGVTINQPRPVPKLGSFEIDHKSVALVHNSRSRFTIVLYSRIRGSP